MLGQKHIVVAYKESHIVLDAREQRFINRSERDVLGRSLVSQKRLVDFRQTLLVVEDVAEKGILIVVLRRPHGVVASLAYIILHPAVQRQESRRQATNFIRERHT